MEEEKARNRKRDKKKDMFDIIVPPTTHSEYVARHKTFDTNRIDWAKENRDRLLKKKTPLEEKKEILFALGHGKDLKALYGIQKYLKDPDPELEAWAFLAWQECQNRVLQEGFKRLFGDKDDDADPLVMTGLGKVGKLLRSCFAIAAKDKLAKEQKDIIASVLKNMEKHYRSKAEETLFGEKYARIVVLNPMDVAVGDFIEHVIADCNTKDAFLHLWYFVVNTHILSDTEIEKWMREFS